LSRKKASMGERSMPPMAGMIPRNIWRYGSVSCRENRGRVGEGCRGKQKARAMEGGRREPHAS
jgi:hypothetical protein